MRKHAKTNMYLMLIPGIIGMILFSYLPMGGLIIAFKNYNIVQGVMDSPWVGLDHFISFLKDPYFFRLLKNTILLSSLSLLWAFPIAILFALLLNEIRCNALKKFTQAVSYLPHFISTVIVVGMLMSIVDYNGIVNNFLASIGMERIVFRSDPKYFRMLYIISSLWQETGWESIIYLAAIMGVNQELYESAKLDGCSQIKMITHITLPCIAPTTVVMFLMKVGKLLNVGFEKVYLMYNPLTYETADIISTYVYRRGIEGGQFSYATAVGLFNSVLSVLLLIVANSLAKKYSENSLW